MSSRRRIALLCNHLGTEGLYQHRLWRAAVAYCQQLDIDLVLYTGLMVVYDYPSQRAMAELLRRLDRERIHGVLLTPGLEYFSDAIDLAALVRHYDGLPVASLVQALPGVASIGVDNAAGMREMVEHLIRTHGCRRHVFISGPAQARDGMERLQAWRETLQAHGIAAEDQCVLDGDFIRMLDPQALLARWQQGPRFDAVIAASDLMAMDAVQQLQAAGIRVPEDVAVVGFDDNLHNRLQEPRLSSVAQPLAAQVRAAIDALRQQWGDARHPASDTAPLRCRAVYRNSCGCSADHGQPLDELAASLQQAHRHGIRLPQQIERELAQADDRLRTALDSWTALSHPSWQGLPAVAPAELAQARDLMLREVAQSGLRTLSPGGLKSQEAFDILNRSLQAADLQTIGPLLADCLPRLGIDSFSVSVFPSVVRAADPSRPPAADGEHGEWLLPLVACIDAQALTLPNEAHALSALGPPLWLEALAPCNLARMPIVSEQGWYGVLTLRLVDSIEQVAYHVEGALSTLFQRELRAQRLAAERERELRLHLAQAERTRTIDELVHGLAHEINTPLGIAITSTSTIGENRGHVAQRLRDGTLPKSELTAFLAGTAQGLELTARSLARIDSLVQTLKKAAISEYGGERVRLRLDQLLHQVLTLHQTEIALRFISVETELAPVEVELVAPVMTELVSALIRNALDHAFAPPLLREPRLCISLRELAQGQLELSINDNGGGVPADMLPRLFQPFASARRELGHRGLGLAMVSSLVTDGLGGTIHHEAPDGGGARFVLHFASTRPQRQR